ncbi:hypothetical protein CASFOL_018976 [Castilleja foliolosa]|uniref:C2 NT-type domain-containing protein n=1 Tax=Castilleja foliolosa TaxID=1961234 RepID=A0ABD3D7F7_9LAMI
MVQGPSTKTRKPPSLHLDYTIHIHEIKPWPPSQSLKTIRAVVIQWENGDRNSGLTNQVVPSIEDGKIEFNESFKLPATLIRDKSIKTGNGRNFQKNCVELNLYEPRRDKTVKKGQVIGTAVLDLAEYGVVRGSLDLSVPINCKRTYGNSAQPVMFLKIQSVERTRAGSSSREVLVCEGSGAFEEYVEEAEVASCTTDDDGSSQSSVAVTLAAVETNGSLSPQNKENEKATTNDNASESKLDDNQATQSQSLASKSEDIEKSTSSNIKVYEREGDDIHENVPQVDLIDGETSGKYQKYTKSEDEEKIAVNGTFLNIDKQKHVKSVRSLLDSSRSNGSVRNNQFSIKEPKNGLSDNRVQHLENRMEILEGELREAAAIEVSLYSVIAEHGSSTNKVHAPARRLSRLYFHASKQSSKSLRWSAAKSIVSGLILVSKACGNDVPRLTFWLSNTIVLRVIMSKSFGDSKPAISVRPAIETAGNGNKKSSPLKWESISSKSTRIAIEECFGDWENPQTFVAALEKVEAWIFSRIIESIWWQTFTPHMQSGNAKEIRSSLDSESSALYRRTASSIEQQQSNFSLELWKKAFRDACERICPVRAGGHDCGCLHVLSRVVMEQLIGRLDVAMFNAVLRESADEIPTDPVADPISDADVLPIPAGKASFGAGAQLKNAIGNWSRWLTDQFGIDDDDLLDSEDTISNDTSSKSFHLLNALSDLMMLPKDLLLSRTVRKEVCPTFGPPIIRRVLNYFVPDEFCPDPIPNVVLEALNSEDCFDSEDNSIMNFPCGAAPTVYQPPPADSVASIIGEFDSHSQLTRIRSSVLKKSQTSDDELDELDSPLKSIIVDGLQAPPSPVKPGWISKENGSRNALRYQLLRDMWMECD